MEDIGFSSGQAIKFGWKTLKEHVWFFVSLYLVSMIIAVIPIFGIAYLLENPLSNETLHNISIGLLILLFIILNLGFILGYTRICIKYGRGEDPKWSDLFSRFLAVPSFIIACILYVIIVIIGFILLIFPGLIWSMQFSLFMFFIADQQVGPIKALELSSIHTHGAKWDLFAFFHVAYAVMLIGFFALGVGIIAALPTVLVAIAWIYKILRKPKMGIV